MKSVFFNNQTIYLVTDLKYESESHFYSIKEFDISFFITLIIKNQIEKIYVYDQDANSLWNNFKSHFVIIEAGGGKVFNEKNEVLFIYRNNKWDLPKGKIEKNETIKNAAIRDVEEETGIENLKLINSLLTTYHIYKHKKKYVLKISYWFKMTSDFKGELLPQEEEGITKVEWLSNDKVKKALENTYENIKLLFI